MRIHINLKLYKIWLSYKKKQKFEALFNINFEMKF